MIILFARKGCGEWSRPSYSYRSVVLLGEFLKQVDFSEEVVRNPHLLDVR